jgi:O-antigen ligase
MMPLSLSRIRLASLLWLVTACAVGLLAATQPVAVVVIGGALFAFLILAGISPLSAWMVLLILAPMRTLIATESRVPMPLDIGQIALLAVIGAWLIHRLARERRLLSLSFSPVLIPVGIFIIVGVASAFSALSMSAWLTEWLKWVEIALLIVLTLDLAGERRWEWLLFGLVVAALANAIIGIYEFFGGSGLLSLLINDRYFRAFGTFGQPNPFGGFMGLVAPLALMATFAYLWRLQRTGKGLFLALFYGSAAILIAVALVMSWSRGAWLAALVSVGAMVFAVPRKVWRSIALVAVVVGVSALLWYSGRLPASVVARINSATEELFAFDDVRGVDITPENYAVVERLAHWQAALNMARANPWLGVGLGNYEVAYPQYRLINWGFPLGHAHNYYLNILAEAGIIGLVGYAALWIGVFWLTWRTRQHPDPFSRLIVIGLLGSWTYLSIHSLTDNLYVNNLFLHLGVMLGLLAVLYNQVSAKVSLRNS